MLTSRLIRFNLRDVKNALKGVQPVHSEPEEPTPQLSFGDVYTEFNR
jgi:hypothetical protein